MRGAFLQNERGKVMDVHGGRDEENRDIIVWNKHGKINQQWDLIYKDKYPRDPRKGELNKDFGLYVDRTFYIRSEMRSKRYLDLIGSGFVIKTRNGRKTQQWWFDQKTLTIKTRYNNQSWDIQSSGKHANIRISGTNLKWW
jgi:membrane carboxypeptidase/penicillin-binding protein PbpC